MAKGKAGQPSSQGLASYLERIRQGPEASWTKDELLTCVHWQKQLTALIIGVVWGFLPLKGLEGFIYFFVVQLLSTIVFYRGVLRVDEEVHGGVGEALVDGFHTSTAMFVLFWVLTFNVLQVPLA
ncbi:hypothetical protein GPECTOR_2g974 [Gonium pectorale]|uniref:Rab5-interacting protein n=1 Tax=Gonium pectorale TaxID=33097 RepID=A0A150H2A3_GONPE|nr:hypothetical protein GPECTOR_2g974 [Gonium pectorale]|eukprot:KXZ56092.1 hypothetical protein GPECTOR_2g974 [Gonium pectorale]